MIGLPTRMARAAVSAAAWPAGAVEAVASAGFSDQAACQPRRPDTSVITLLRCPPQRTRRVNGCVAGAVAGDDPDHERSAAVRHRRYASDGGGAVAVRSKSQPPRQRALLGYPPRREAAGPHRVAVADAGREHGMAPRGEARRLVDGEREGLGGGG